MFKGFVIIQNIDEFLKVAKVIPYAYTSAISVMGIAIFTLNFNCFFVILFF